MRIPRNMRTIVRKIEFYSNFLAYHIHKDYYGYYNVDFANFGKNPFNANIFTRIFDGKEFSVGLDKTSLSNTLRDIMYKTGAMRLVYVEHDDGSIEINEEITTPYNPVR